MFDITNHALERYVSRILKLKLDKGEYTDLMKEMGVDIIKTITDMIRDSDMIFSHNGSGYFLYRNIAIIIKDDCVVTVYKIYDEFEEFPDYINYIKNTQKAIKELTEKHQQARFERDNKQMNQLRLRLDQYKEFFFENKLSAKPQEE